VRMTGIDALILCPICFGPHAEWQGRKGFLRQVIDSWTKRHCPVCDGNGEVLASVAAERMAIDIPGDPKWTRLAGPNSS